MKDKHLFQLQLVVLLPLSCTSFPYFYVLVEHPTSIHYLGEELHSSS